MMKLFRSLLGKTPQGMIVEAVAGKVIDKIEDKVEEAIKDKVEDLKSSVSEAVEQKLPLSKKPSASQPMATSATEPKKPSKSGSKPKA